jgi:Ran GTPase-activating protein (RanGAP) involved in mRNA processing and transport
MSQTDDSDPIGAMILQRFGGTSGTIASSTDDFTPEAIAAAISTLPKDVKEVLPRIAANDPGLTVVENYSFDTSQHLGNEGLRVVAWVLELNTVVTKLILPANSIESQGVKAIAMMFKVNRTITEIYMHRNSIGDGGAKYFGEVIKAGIIVRLDVARNSVGDEGAKFLAEAIKVNSALAYLGLSGNIIGDGGGTFLAEAIKANSTLTGLDLEGNSISRALEQTISALMATPGMCVFLWEHEIACLMLVLRCRCGESSSSESS